MVPGISVVVATYNGERYIAQQIESILSQLAGDDELIISDDRSTDRTIEIVDLIKNERVKVFTSKGERGPIGNFENGLALATKDVVVLADQDDVWLPNRILCIREYFRNSSSKFDLLVLNSRVVNESLNFSASTAFEILNSGPGIVKNIFRNTYIGCHMAFKRELVSLALPFPRRIPMHDVWIGLVSELVGTVTFCDSETMLFRRTGSNFTKPSYNWRTRIAWRLGLTFSLLVFVLKNRRVFNDEL